MKTYTQAQFDAAVALAIDEAAAPRAALVESATMAERARATAILEAGQFSPLAVKLVSLGMSAEDAAEILAAATAAEQAPPAPANTTADKAVAMLSADQAEQRADVSSPVATARAFNAARKGVLVNG